MVTPLWSVLLDIEYGPASAWRQYSGLNNTQVLFRLHFTVVQLMCVHVCSCNYLHWGEPCRRLICKCSEYLLASCSNGSFLECLPLTAEAPGSIPCREMLVSTSSLGWRWPSQDVKSLHNSIINKFLHYMITSAIFQKIIFTSTSLKE